MRLSQTSIEALVPHDNQPILSLRVLEWVLELAQVWALEWVLELAQVWAPEWVLELAQA
jgi:hypothetical protein